MNATTLEAEYAVRSYDSGETLEGNPDAALIKASIDEEPTGAVPAYRGSDGTWRYVQPSEVEHYRRDLGEDVITVFVEEWWS